MHFVMLALQATIGLGVFAFDPVMIDSSPIAREPQVAVSELGHVFVTYGNGNSIFVTVSTDGGRRFDPPRVIGSVPALSLGMRRGPRIAATDSAVIVAAVGGAEGKGRDGDLLAWRSTDLGKNWSGPIRVNSVEKSAREGLHALTAGPKNSFFCCWLDDRNGRKEVFGARSTDAGKTWEPDRLVYRSPEKSVCECCHPSAAFAPDGTLYVMWRNSLDGARDLYLAKSSDGITFSAARKLGAETWKLNACPMDGGAIAVDENGAVQTVWRRESNLFRSRPGEQERTLGPGVQPWVASGPNGPVFVALKSRPGELWAWSSEGTPVRLAESANDPSIASALGGKGLVIAVWEESGKGIRAAVLVPKKQAPL